MESHMARIDSRRLSQEFLSASGIASRQKNHAGVEEDVRIFVFSGENFLFDLHGLRELASAIKRPGKRVFRGRGVA
jgi:hypothetical protein